MGKTDKELAVELVIAQIQASSVIKKNQLETGHVLTAEIVNKLIASYYNTLQSLGDK